MFYEDILKNLYNEKVKFVVAGGVAMVLYGVVRLTVDLDLVVFLEKSNLERFVSVIKNLGYKQKLPVDEKDFLDPAIRRKWREDKNMTVFSFYKPDKPINIVDVFIEEPIPFDEIEKEMVLFDAGDFTIPVISKKHLKLMKLSADREQDRADIEVLEALESEQGRYEL